ncbi:hypothetical protein [Ekhidna sp.]|jgi:hypothetical protein|uniref:hypothetical protein n=1 Tax=Ekhidna sp. TaxID=2608089 RepID=UPI0032EEDF22
MNQRQINKVEMMETTNNYLDANTAIWSAIPIITSYKNRLSQVIDELKTAAQDQDAAQVFIGSNLQTLKITIAEKMDILDDILEAYADDNGNTELLAQAENSKTDYIRLTNEAFETKVKNVISLLESNVAEMADYGLTQDQIDDAKLSFSTYQDKRGMPRSYKVASRQATQSIEELIDEGDKALEKLDRVMKRFKRSNSTFFNGYQAARTIVDD